MLALAQAAASPDGLLVVSPEGEMVFMNQRFAEVWGFSPEDLATRDDERALAAAVKRVVDPDAFITRVRELYGSADGPAHDEVELKDGRTLDRYGTPLFTPDGEYLGWAWYFRDVTEHKRAEAQLRELAHTLQASLLPPHPPAIPGMEIATRYEPAAAPGLIVGGDFFDVFRLRSNAWGLAIGDVCGKGARAAAFTSLVRYTLRAAAAHHVQPVDVLTELNEVLVDSASDDDAFCSLAFARLEQDVCGAWVTLACGGHPRPIVVRRAGWVDVRGQAGTLLGLFDTVQLSEDRVGLGPGDALVFFTDGIVEARDATGELFDDERLVRVLLAHAGSSAGVIADAVLQAATAHALGKLADDAAVLVVRVPEDADDPEERRRVVAAVAGDEGALPDYPVGEPPWPADKRAPAPREAWHRIDVVPDVGTTAHRFVAAVLHSWRLSHLAHGDVPEIAARVAEQVHGAVALGVRYDGERVRVEVDGRYDASRVTVSGALACGIADAPDSERVWFEVAVG